MHKAALAMVLIGVSTASAQAQAAAGAVDRASAYYHYTLAHMYAELAGNPGRGSADYINKAIDNYKAAIKADPKTPMLSEELSELYIAAGRLREAENDANEALRANPNDISAIRLLAHVYTRQIGDAQQNKIDESMLKKAIDQYQRITRLDPKDIDSWLMLGKLQKVSQNSVESKDAFNKVLEIEPDNEEALTNLANVYADLGDNQTAVGLLKRLADKNPTERSLRELARTYASMRQYSLAADTLTKVLDLNPPDVTEVKRELAKDQMFGEQYGAAIKTYQDIAEDEPDDPEPYLRMSQIYLQQKDYAKAREASDKARKLDPDNIEIRYSLVSILEAEGKSSEAIQLLKDIIDGTTKKTYSAAEKGVRLELLDRLAGMYIAGEQIENAIEVFKQEAVIDSTLAPRVSAKIIETYEIGKDFPKAEQEANDAVKKWPADRDVRITRAKLLAEMGKNDAAAADVKKLLDGKNDRETHLALAEIYEKGKHFDEVGKELDAAEKLSDSPQEKQDIWFRRGAMYERMKKTDLAEAQFRKVIDADPRSAGALNYLGYMLADRNVRLPEALQLITKALDIDPGNGAYLDSLGWVYYRLGRLDEAEQNLRRALEKTPRDATVHDHMAEVLMRQAKVKEAIAQWEISLKEWETGSPADLEPAEVSKVKTKLEGAKVRLAKESPRPNK